jgi:putative DNA primase/helicase
MSKSERHLAALAYAGAGIPVFPCAVGDKRPATKHGFKDASTDPRQIDAWWDAADYNVAVEPERLGAAVIDIDPKNGADAAPYPATFTTGTPSGGKHLWYLGSLPPSVQKLAPGVDTRGAGGYVLVPPSAVNGKPYTGSFPPCEWDMEPLPAEISARLTPVQGMEKRTAAPDVELDKPLAIEEARRYLSREPRPVEGAGSDDQCYRVASKLKDLGVSAERCADLMREWQPYFDEDWTEAKIANAYGYGQNEPGSDVPRSGAETFGAHVPTDGIVNKPQSVRITKGGGKPQRIEWLWQDWLPRGKLTILGGEKGVGKSTMTYHILATITSGGQWPDGTRAPVGDVLIWSAEDDWADTILPRLMVAGANFEHVYRVDGVTIEDGQSRSFDPSIDMRGLLDAAKVIPNLAAVLIDPIVSAVAGDSHKNAETRRGLQPLVDFAGARRAALIGITHFSKNTQGKSPLDRLNGSLAFGAVSRMVWGAVKSEDESASRRFVRVAANISKMGGAFDYTLHQRPVPGETADFTAQGITWGSFTDGDARALINDVQGGEDGKNKVKIAEDFLIGVLGGRGMVECADVKAAARAHDITDDTLRRARRNLSVKADQRSGAGPAIWCWTLPATWQEIEY